MTTTTIKQGAIEVYIDAYMRMTRDGEKIFKLPVATKLKILGNLRELKGHYESYLKLREDFKEGLPAGDNPKLTKAQQAEWKEIIDTDVEVNLAPIHATDLNLDKNDIDFSVLTKLGDLVKLD